MKCKNDLSPKWKVLYDEFDIDSGKPLSDQCDNLKEDLIQLQYGDEYILDIGWYPEYDEYGSLQLLLVKNYQWEDPILSRKLKNIEQLEDILSEIEIFICSLT